MTILSRAYAENESFKTMMADYGITINSSFWADFTIADAYGIKAVGDTCKRAAAAWADSPEMMGELTLVLNHKIWHYYETNEKLARAYDGLWRDIQGDCFDRFSGDDLSTYYNLVG